MNLFFLVAVYYIPESPNYLMSRGREKEAEKVLNLLDIGQAHNLFSRIFPNTNRHFFSNFSCMFLILNIFFCLNFNFSNLLDMRNLQEQGKKAFCYQKLVLSVSLPT